METVGANRHVGVRPHEPRRDVGGRPAWIPTVTAIASPGRVDVLVGRIGAEGEQPATIGDGAPGATDPFRPIADTRPRPRIAAEMDRLDRGDDAELVEPTDIRWVDEG